MSDQEQGRPPEEQPTTEEPAESGALEDEDGDED
jgi:hypothetical protein